MASDYVPDSQYIVDEEQFGNAEQEQGPVHENKIAEMEKMVWDMDTVLLHEELNTERTCSHGLTILPELLCHNTKGCVTCSSVKFTKEIHKGRTGREEAEIIGQYKNNKEAIDKMTELEIIGFMSLCMED
eukprot:11893189-Heterocapsa_arctica.AAC.1